MSQSTVAYRTCARRSFDNLTESDSQPKNLTDQPDYNPNTVHCLCGADADLMMLGLATHEPHFYIIREEFKPNMDRPCDVCGLTGAKYTYFHDDPCSFPRFIVVSSSIVVMDISVSLLFLFFPDAPHH